MLRRREVSAGDDPKPPPLVAWIVRGVVLSLAIGLTVGAYLVPRSAVLPTLAFFTWALLFARAAIVLPGQLGLFPEPEEDSDPSAQRPTDDEEVYRIDV